jgi:hypothetical protein
VELEGEGPFTELLAELFENNTRPRGLARYKMGYGENPLFAGLPDE